VDEYRYLSETTDLVFSPDIGSLSTRHVDLQTSPSHYKIWKPRFFMLDQSFGLSKWSYRDSCTCFTLPQVCRLLANQLGVVFLFFQKQKNCLPQWALKCDSKEKHVQSS